MDLQDYGTALRRYWKTWTGLTLAGLLCALTVVLAASPTYEARAQVFVASTGDGTSGAQFVNQRVQSYPDVAESRSVLAPVIEDLELRETLATLRARVHATNAPDTSQIEIVVGDEDPTRAAAVANAVAERFGTVVEGLERPADGASPVALTVTNPATVPVSPVFPDPVLLLLLGGVVGLALGTAAAIVRSRVDTRVHDEADVRAAWGPDGQAVAVLSTPSGGLRGRRLRAARPATSVARRLGSLAHERPVRVVVLSPSSGGRHATEALAGEVAAQLHADDLAVVVADERPAVPGATARESRADVELVVGNPTAPMREWRRIAATHDGVVLVVEAGRVHGADLADVRSMLSEVGLPVIAVVLEGSRRGVGRTEVTEPHARAGAPARQAPLPRSPRARAGVPAGRP